MTLIGTDGPVGEGQTVALTPADHDLDDVAEKAAGGIGVAQFAGALEVFPKQSGRIPQVIGKARPSCSKNEFEPRMFHLTRTSPRAYVPKNVGFGRLQCLADLMRIAPISPKGVVRVRDLARLVLSVRSDDGDLAAGPADVGGGARRKSLHVSRPRSRDQARVPASRHRWPSVRVGSRRMGSSLAPPGSSRHRSTSLM
jgi:hypothetical protein